MFNRSAYAASINEDATPNTVVLQVKATDADTPSNAMLEFSIDSVTGDLLTANTQYSGSLTL